MPEVSRLILRNRYRDSPEFLDHRLKEALAARDAAE
jgi:hypothetical protein